MVKSASSKCLELLKWLLIKLEAVGEMTASPAQHQGLASVRRAVWATGFAVKPASRQARQAGMMERLDATVTPEGSNMLLPSGWKMKRMHSGSTAWWSMMEKK